MPILRCQPRKKGRVQAPEKQENDLEFDFSFEIDQTPVQRPSIVYELLMKYGSNPPTADSTSPFLAEKFRAIRQK